MKQSRISRGGLVTLLAGLLTMAMVAVGPVGQAGAEAARTSSSTLAKPVLSSDYGKAVSRVEGTFGKHGTVTGTFTPKRFKVGKSGNLRAVGKLRATMTRGSGHVVGTTTKTVSLRVKKAEGQSLRTAAAGSCDVLNLVLGPLDLDLLGLQVHLDKVVLKIVAASGAGNLLGNLLCAVAGLLDQNGLLTQVSQILNSILAILRL
ncbi:hypothetical protein ACT8ZV_05655 [Nocardioides sp. MAHUQ-72]|uniref:hypothetical protein n=1 Tax=unclassified Nocardioides TaxID=2615069 RepID=UPI00360E952A